MVYPFFVCSYAFLFDRPTTSGRKGHRKLGANYANHDGWARSHLPLPRPAEAFSTSEGEAANYKNVSGRAEFGTERFSRTERNILAAD